MHHGQEETRGVEEACIALARVYEGAELYRKAENQAPDAAHIPQEDEDELEDGDIEVEIVSDDSF